MTTIAWDGKSLAADKRVVICGLQRTTTKIHKVGAALVGCSGSGYQAAEMLAWARAGFKKNTFPESQRDDELAVEMLVILPTGIQVYGDTPYAVEYEDKHFAIGSGRDFALAAMFLGKSAQDAVLLAAEFDPGTGSGVDTLTL